MRIAGYRRTRTGPNLRRRFKASCQNARCLPHFHFPLLSSRVFFSFCFGIRYFRCLRVSGKLAGMQWRTRLCRSIGLLSAASRCKR